MSKAMMRSIKNVTNGYTSAQVKVRNATSNDAWGPNTADMQDIAQMTFQNHELFEVMDMIDRRLNDKGKNWRHVMKALTLLDYIIHCGSENVVLWSKDNLYVIKTLREFQYIDEDGRDQGANIRAKAKELTSLLQDDDRLREERKGGMARQQQQRQRRRTNSRPPRPEGLSPSMTGSSRRNTNPRASPAGDSELQRALEESRLTMEQDEQRRKEMMGSETDLKKALMLSKEEEEQRGKTSQAGMIFENHSQPNLIDTSDVWAPQQQQVYMQPQFTQPQQQQQQQQPMYQNTGTDLFGNPMFPQQQQPMATGMLQNAYNTGGPFQQQQPQQFTGNPYMQQQFTPQPQQPPQQQEPEPLQPLKTGSNNPFAKLSQPQQQSAAPPQRTQPSLQEIQQQQQQPQPQPQQLQQQRTNNSNFDAAHMNNLNTLLSEKDGIDTFGNVGDLRIPAQHTSTSFVNSAGQKTGNGQGYQQSNNPFMAQYTGVATTNQIQPAFTGYGFGNAPQSQQAYQQRNNGNNGPNSLIDL